MWSTAGENWITSSCLKKVINPKRSMSVHFMFCNSLRTRWELWCKRQLEFISIKNELWTIKLLLLNQKIGACMLTNVHIDPRIDKQSGEGEQISAKQKKI